MPRAFFQTAAYLVYLAACTLARLVPLTFLFLLGKGLGALAFLLFRTRARITQSNLRLALRIPNSEAHRLAFSHFTTCAANLLCMLKVPSMSDAALWRHISLDVTSRLPEEPPPNGWIIVTPHYGNWELLARLSTFLPQYRFGTLYRGVSNPWINTHLQTSRNRRGLRLFDRRTEFWKAVAFLEEGGVLGVLADQSAGLAGTWLPFFQRLASTSTLPAQLAQRVHSDVIPFFAQTVGIAQWKIHLGNALPPNNDPEACTAAINRAFEHQILASPADWLWSHERWKTPRFGFLIRGWKGRIHLPAGSSPADLLPFRILVRSPDSLTEAQAAAPWVEKIRSSRPDAHVTVASTSALSCFWEQCPGIDSVLPLPENTITLRRGLVLRRSQPFHAAILLAPSPSHAWEVFLANIPVRLGHPPRTLLCHWHQEPNSPRLLPTGSDRYQHMLRAAGAQVS